MLWTADVNSASWQLKQTFRSCRRRWNREKTAGDSTHGGYASTYSFHQVRRVPR